MKLKCVDNKKETGIFNKTISKVEGLTVGKIYNASTVFDVSGGYSRDPCFLVYNDDSQWKTYPTKYFVPED